MDAGKRANSISQFCPIDLWAARSGDEDCQDAFTETLAKTLSDEAGRATSVSPSVNPAQVELVVRGRLGLPHTGLTSQDLFEADDPSRLLDLNDTAGLRSFHGLIRELSRSVVCDLTNSREPERTTWSWFKNLTQLLRK